MYGLPADFDPGFFVGQVLVQVCLNENQISLQFEDKTFLTLEGEYSCDSVRAPGREGTRAVPEFDLALPRLVGQAVAKASGTRDGTLTLVFENAMQLTCFDTAHYESYQISHRGRVIIV